MKQHILILLLVVPILLHPFAVQAGEEEADEKPAKVADAAIDLAVPDSPAFAILGLSPNDVERPSSPREFAASLVQGVDANGNLQTGVAIDTAPYMVFRGKETTLTDYQSNYQTRFLSRTMFSFATAKGATDDDKSVRIAAGFRFTPWDDGDPRMDKGFLKCLTDAVTDVPLTQQREKHELLVQRDRLEIDIAKATDEQTKKELRSQKDSLDKKIDKLEKEGTAELNKKSASGIEECRKSKKFRSNLWNKSSWSFGAAPTFTSTTGETDDLNFSGMGLWTSVALGLGEHAQVICHARYRNKEQVPDPDNAGQFFEQDSLRVGGRIRYGTPELNFNAEGMYIVEDQKNGREDDNKAKYGIGAEYNAAKDVWLVFSIGSESGNDKGDKLSVLGNLRFAFSPSPTMKF